MKKNSALWSTSLGVLFILMAAGCGRQKQPVEPTETCTECHETIAPSHEHVDDTHTPHSHNHKHADVKDKHDSSAGEIQARLEQGHELHKILSGHEQVKKVKEGAQVRKDHEEKIFLFNLKAPFHSTSRGFTPMVLFGLVDENGHAVSKYGKYLQVGEHSPMTVHVYKPGPYYINFITSNILSVFKRPVDFRLSPDKELLEKVAGKPMTGLGPIYLSPGESTAEYTIEVGINTPKKASNGGVYTFNGVHIIFDGAAVY